VTLAGEGDVRVTDEANDSDVVTVGLCAEHVGGNLPLAQVGVVHENQGQLLSGCAEETEVARGVGHGEQSGVETFASIVVVEPESVRVFALGVVCGHNEGFRAVLVDVVGGEGRFSRARES